MPSASDILLLCLAVLVAYQVSQGAVYFSIATDVVAGVVWVVRMKQLRRSDQPMSLCSNRGIVSLIFLWPLGAYYFYSDRWKFKHERYKLSREKDSASSVSSQEPLPTFASLSEAIVHAEERANHEKQRIEITDTWADTTQPWIYYITGPGHIYRLEAGGGMSELRGETWHRI
jgi:hypothetical protein